MKNRLFIYNGQTWKVPKQWYRVAKGRIVKKGDRILYYTGWHETVRIGGHVNDGIYIRKRFT